LGVVLISSLMWQNLHRGAVSGGEIRMWVIALHQHRRIACGLKRAHRSPKILDLVRLLTNKSGSLEIIVVFQACDPSVGFRRSRIACHRAGILRSTDALHRPHVAH